VGKGARGALIFVVVLAAGGGIALHNMTRDATRPFELAPSAGCVVTSAGRDVALDLTQMANAATITAVGIGRKVPERAVVVALATALQESKLENLGHGDRDSLGLFQQRPSQGWGTPEQVQDPRYASRKFYNALLKVKGWQKMRVTDAAQKVQRSAYPNAYEKWADEAQVMADVLLGKVSAAVVCTLPDGGTTSVQIQRDGQSTVAALAESMSLDYGYGLTMNTDPQGGAVRVAAASGALGWAYAHWLVSQAADRGVARVTYAGHEWTAKSGEWGPAPSHDASQVVASVV
jgi:hypothetical protein